MRAAILAQDRYPISMPFASGLESFVWHLTRGLRHRGVDVTAFAGSGGWLEKFQQMRLVVLTEQGWKVA